MARGEIVLTVQTTAGAAVNGATGTVNIRGGGLATIYSAATGGTTLANPVTTSANGRLDGWLDEGSYDVTIAGSGITTYTQSIEIVNGAAHNAFDGARIASATIPTAAYGALSVTGAKVASQTITKDKLEASVLPVGSTLLWWRPSAATAIPSGWLELNGQTVIAANHDFAGGGTITLPDMRNKYPIGADSATTYGQAGTPTVAPGVTAGGNNNAGGANVRDISHTHTITHTHDYSHTHGMPDHTHGFTAPDHLHTFGSLYYVFGTNQNTGVYAIANSIVTGPADRPLSGTTGGASNGNTTTSQSASTTGAASNGSSGTALSSTQDWRPLSYGFIFLIKVKAT